MLFRKRTPRSCPMCLYSTNLSEHQLLCSKCGVVADSYSCRKYKYDPCKRIPPTVRAPDFQKYRDDDFKLE